MTACCREACDRRASLYPLVRVPARGASMRHALLMVFNLPVCRDHFFKIEIEDLLLPEGKRRLQVALMARGRAMPDFARADIAVGRLGDARWRAFQETKGQPE